MVQRLVLALTVVQVQVLELVKVTVTVKWKMTMTATEWRGQWPGEPQSWRGQHERRAQCGGGEGKGLGWRCGGREQERGQQKELGWKG